MANSILAVLIVTLLAAVTAKPNADIGKDSIEKGFSFNFSWSFTPSIPASPHPDLTPACVISTHNAVAAKATAPCTCGTTPAANCMVNQVCTVNWAGAGTCSTLTPCTATVAATPEVCECGIGAAALTCIAPMNGCINQVPPMCL